MTDTTLAIDFGTSNSLVGAWRDGRRVEALALDEAAMDPTLMRTLLYFPNRDVCFYGAAAIQQYLENEMDGRLFRSFKSHLPNKNYLGTFIDDRPLPLESMIGLFMLELRKRAERILDQELDTAVIGRPARYSLDIAADNFALHRMTKAAEFAGFKNVTFVPEPLAAALDMRRTLRDEKLLLVGDFGGGTSDFTLIRVGPFAFAKEHVLGLDGCPKAGDALDSLFMSHRLNDFFGAKSEFKVALGSNRLRMPPSIMERLNRPAHIVHLKEPSTYEFIREIRKGALSTKDKQAVDRLFLLIEDQQIFPFFECIERTKRELSGHEQATFRFDYPGLEISADFQRPDFEEWAQPTSESIFRALDECLKQAQVSDGQVDLVCLTGGSAQVPLIRNELVRRFGEEKLQTQSHFHSVLSGLIEMAGHQSTN
ncbi:MAG: Hsp70 family protein [Bdellovibrionaceae bacterium]|nr:Hsp70 family protein [Pseudobdellovibrionaceae bacterium]